MSFRWVVSNRTLIFQMISPSLTVADVHACETEVKQRGQNYQLVMLDLAKVSFIEGGTLAILGKMSEKLAEESSVRLMVIANGQVTQSITQAGLVDCLPCYEGIVSVPMDDDLVISLPELNFESLWKVFLPAIELNFRIYARMEIQSKPVGPNRVKADIAGFGGFYCDRRKGNLALFFEDQSYLNLISSIMIQKATPLDGEVSDWAAELVNSILGRAKSDFRTMGYSFSLGIPATLRGEEVKALTSLQPNEESQWLQVEGEFGRAQVQLSISDIHKSE